MFRAVLRRAWLIVIAALVVGIASFSVAKRRPTEYTAVAQLQVKNANIMRDAIGLPPAAPIDAVLVEIPPQIHQLATAERAVRLLGTKSPPRPDQLLADSSASIDVNSGLIGVAAKAGDPDAAANLANSLAQAYIDLQDGRIVGRIAAARIQLERTMRQRTTMLRQRAAHIRTSRATPADQVAVAVEESNLRSLANRIEQLRLTGALFPQPVAFDHPAAPGSVGGVSPKLVGMIGIVLGLIGGVAAVAVRELTDRRITSLRKLEQIFDAPVLARIPRSRRLPKKLPLDRLRASETEPFRALLARLWHRTTAPAANHVVLTSPDGDRWSSATAWYLSATAAVSGARTLLISADVGAPVTVDVGAGAHIDVGAPGGASDTKAGYDLTVIESPRPWLTADTAPFGNREYGTVVVCRRGSLYPEQAESLRSMLQGMGSRLLGVVAIGFGHRDE